MPSSHDLSSCMPERTTADDKQRRTRRDSGTRWKMDENHSPSAETDAASFETDEHDQSTSSDSRWMTIDEIRDIYTEQADQMERIAGFNRLLTGRFRRTLFGKADGRVLDVACGLGMNFQYLPKRVEYVGIDISPDMLEKAEANYDRLKRGDTLREMDAQNLAFPDNSFDTVISSLSTCTFPDPVTALREMQRVCKPDGQILLLEHGRSDNRAIARFQDWRADAHYENEGCRWNQDPVELVSQAELSVRDITTSLLGIITTIEAQPTTLE